MSISVSPGNRQTFVRLLVIGFFGVWFPFMEAQAQDPGLPDSLRGAVAETAKNDLTIPKIQQAPLDAVVVFNADGKSQIRLPGWRLEDLDTIWDLLLKERQAPNPPFILQEITATGKVVDNRVETEIRITLTTVNNRSVLVPIGLKEGVFPFADTPPDGGKSKAPYRYVGPGSAELIFSPENGQYLALISPPTQKPTSSESPSTMESSAEASAGPAPVERREESDQRKEGGKVELRHELELTLWFPLTRIGNEESRLAISFPQAVGSQFVLTVPIRDAVATVTQGSLLDPFEPPNQKTTQFKMLGLKPDFEVTWRQKKTETVDERPVLSVDEASIIARMETKSTIYDVSLPIRSRTVGFERIQIQLPQGTSLDRESTDRYAALGGYSFGLLAKEERTALTPPANEPLEGLARPEPAQILEIRLPRKTVGPVTVRFKAVQQNELEQTSGGWHNLGGFEVREAERQTGQLAVIIPANMRPNWSPIRGIRRSESSGTAQQDGVDARFEFFTQPFLLRCKIVSPQTKINAKPEYQILINKGSLVLTTRLSFAVFGSKTEKLAIQLPGWQWNNEIGPSGIVDSVGVEQDENGLLSIPLRVPQDGEFEIEFKASRPISFPDEGKHRLVIPLPQPVADWTQSATVVIVPANNVEVNPVDEDFQPTVSTSETDESKVRVSSQRTQGLSRRSRRSLTATIEIPDRQQEPLYYETEQDASVFVADIQYHRQKIAATMQTEIRLRAPDDHVAQMISYDVSYVPVERLYFLVPNSLVVGGQLTARLGGKTLELRDVVPGPDETVPENWSKKMLQLPEAMFKFQMVFSYPIPPVAIEHDQTTTFALSFIRPVETQVFDHRVNMTVPTGFQIKLDDDAQLLWTSVDTDTSLSGTVFRSTQSPNRISLWISTGERDALGTTVVERAWLQTWLTGTVRMDRGSFLVTSERQESISLWLPPEAVKGRIFVYRNKKPVVPDVSPRGELRIPLEEQRGRSVLIEVDYRIAPFETPNRLVDLELPHFGTGPETLVRSEFWQIILPQNRHIVGVPNGWTPEYEWSWTNGLFWGRVPSLRKEDVGFDADSSKAFSIPTESNQYLFSSLHPSPNVTLTILDRSVIVLLSSGLTLLLGLMLIYFPKTRYIGSLFGLAVALLAMMLYRPAPVLLMLQASSLGVFLALGTFYVHRILYREEKWIVPKTRAWADASRPSEVYSVIMDEESERKSGESPEPVEKREEQ